jgi:hypothetical protein
VRRKIDADQKYTALYNTCHAEWKLTDDKAEVIENDQNLVFADTRLLQEKRRFITAWMTDYSPTTAFRCIHAYLENKTSHATVATTAATMIGQCQQARDVRCAALEKSISSFNDISTPPIGRHYQLKKATDTCLLIRAIMMKADRALKQQSREAESLRWPNLDIEKVVAAQKNLQTWLDAKQPIQKLQVARARLGLRDTPPAVAEPALSSQVAAVIAAFDRIITEGEPELVNAIIRMQDAVILPSSANDARDALRKTYSRLYERCVEQFKAAEKMRDALELDGASASLVKEAARRAEDFLPPFSTDTILEKLAYAVKRYPALVQDEGVTKNKLKGQLSVIEDLRSAFGKKTLPALNRSRDALVFEDGNPKKPVDHQPYMLFWFAFWQTKTAMRRILQLANKCQADLDECTETPADELARLDTITPFINLWNTTKQSNETFLQKERDKLVLPPARSDLFVASVPSASPAAQPANVASAAGPTVAPPATDSLAAVNAIPTDYEPGLVAAFIRVQDCCVDDAGRLEWPAATSAYGTLYERCKATFDKTVRDAVIDTNNQELKTALQNATAFLREFNRDDLIQAVEIHKPPEQSSSPSDLPIKDLEALCKKLNADSHVVFTVHTENLNGLVSTVKSRIAANDQPAACKAYVAAFNARQAFQTQVNLIQSRYDVVNDIYTRAKNPPLLFNTKPFDKCVSHTLVRLPTLKQRSNNAAKTLINFRRQLFLADDDYKTALQTLTELLSDEMGVQTFEAQKDAVYASLLANESTRAATELAALETHAARLSSDTAAVAAQFEAVQACNARYLAGQDTAVETRAAGRVQQATALLAGIPALQDKVQQLVAYDTAVQALESSIAAARETSLANYNTTCTDIADKIKTKEGPPADWQKTLPCLIERLQHDSRTIQTQLEEVRKLKPQALDTIDKGLETRATKFIEAATGAEAIIPKLQRDILQLTTAAGMRVAQRAVLTAVPPETERAQVTLYNPSKLRIDSPKWATFHAARAAATMRIKPTLPLSDERTSIIAKDILKAQNSAKRDDVLLKEPLRIGVLFIGYAVDYRPIVTSQLEDILRLLLPNQTNYTIEPEISPTTYYCKRILVAYMNVKIDHYKDIASACEVEEDDESDCSSNSTEASDAGRSDSNEISTSELEKVFGLKSAQNEIEVIKTAVAHSFDTCVICIEHIIPEADLDHFAPKFTSLFSSPDFEEEYQTLNLSAILHIPVYIEPAYKKYRAATGFMISYFPQVWRVYLEDRDVNNLHILPIPSESRGMVQLDMYDSPRHWLDVTNTNQLKAQLLLAATVAGNLVWLQHFCMDPQDQERKWIKLCHLLLDRKRKPIEALDVKNLADFEAIVKECWDRVSKRGPKASVRPISTAARGSAKTDRDAALFTQFADQFTNSSAFLRFEVSNCILHNLSKDLTNFQTENATKYRCRADCPNRDKVATVFEIVDRLVTEDNYFKFANAKSARTEDEDDRLTNEAVQKLCLKVLPEHLQTLTRCNCNGCNNTRLLISNVCVVMLPLACRTFAPCLASNASRVWKLWNSGIEEADVDSIPESINKLKAALVSHIHNTDPPYFPD